MNDLCCFYEYEEIKNSVILDAVRSTAALQEFFTPSFDGVKASQYCGILNIEGNDYYISTFAHKPKLFLSVSA